MPARPKAEQLPEAIRKELEQKLIASGFSDYRALADWLSVLGYEITKSSLQRWGSRYEERLNALRISTQQAKAICEASPDDDGAMSEALMRLTQDKLFGVLMELEVDPETIDVTKLARAVSDLGRGSVQLKRYQGEVKTRTKAAADAVGETCRAAGVTPETLAKIKQDIYGIAA